MFTLVTATRNRAAPLEKLVLSLQEQSEATFELRVVDQSEGAEAEATRAAIEPLGPRARYLRSAPGLSRARNVGLQGIEPEGFIGFPDDDCWYPASFLAVIEGAFAAHPEAEFLCVRYREPAVENPRFPLRELPLTPDNAFALVCSVGLFIRADRALPFQFNENLGAGTALPCGEEMDLVLRFLRAGKRGVYLPDPFVHHAIERGVAASTRIAAERAQFLIRLHHMESVRDWTGNAMRLVKSLGLAPFDVLQRGRARGRILAVRDFLENPSALGKGPRP